MKYIKKFNEIENPDLEKVDEGIKEWILAGALTLSMGNLKATPTQISNNTGIEQTIKKNDTSLIIDFGSEFESGTYRFSKDKAKTAQEKLAQISSFVQKYKNKNIKITIEGSESQVPNIDAETGRRLPKRGLATMRVAELEDLIKDHLESLTEKGVFKGSFDTTTKIGNTSYKPGENPRQDKFTKEQYVRVTIQVVGDTAVTTFTKNAFSAYSKLGERIFVGTRAIGDGYTKSRSSDDITKSGNVNTGYENVLLRELSSEPEFARSKKEYSGNLYLIPSNWWNKARTTSHITEKQFQEIKNNLEVDSSTGQYCFPEKAAEWIKINNDIIN